MHLHTNFSDSTFSPNEVVEKAGRVGLSVIAIADHDTTGGIQPALDSASREKIEVLFGIAPPSCELYFGLQLPESPLFVDL